MSKLMSISKTRGFKVFLLAVLILFFLIPVSMIRHLIEERSWRAVEVEHDIMRSWGEEFVIQGPILRIPAREYEETKTINEKGEEKINITAHDFSFWLAPDILDADIDLGTEIKKRGIFSAPLFAGTLHLGGRFDLSKIEGDLKPNQRIFYEQAELIIALENQRGIRSIEKAQWNGVDISFMPGQRGFAHTSRDGGIYGLTPMTQTAMEKKYEFAIIMDIQGGKTIRMVPLGETSVFNLKTDWPAPSFQGSYLPTAKTIDETGFEAQWEISHLSRNIPLYWSNQEGEPDFSSAIFGVNFFKPLDQYDLNIRAVKYAVLFIIIPFLGLFLFELLLKKEIHPVQYVLSGIGNIVFYLLLLSFSEHIPFTNAYVISALAVTIMMGLYSRSLLGAWNKSWLMAVIMGLCYTFLYFTLQSEDWALLAGSIGAFAITGIVMFLTRKLDWYSRKETDLEEKFTSDSLS